MLKIGLAGFSQGYYAVTYMRYLVTKPQVTCVGICDLGASEEYVKECAFTTAEKFAKELKAPLFTKFEDLLDTGLDALLVCSETHLHVELAAQALAKGIHVFVSKPLSFDLKDFELLNSASEEAILLCGNPLRYQEDILQFATQIQEGGVGKPYAMNATICHQAMIHQEWERDPARSGSNLGTYSPYLFDLANWIIGEKLVSIFARGGNYNTPQIDPEDTLHISGQLACGGLCFVELHSGINQPHPFFKAEVVGTRDWLSVVYEDNEASSSGDKDIVDLGFIQEGDPGALEMDHFLDCIEKGEAPGCSMADMKYTVACVEAVKKSLISGQQEPVEEG